MEDGDLPQGCVNVDGAAFSLFLTYTLSPSQRPRDHVQLGPLCFQLAGYSTESMALPAPSSQEEQQESRGQLSWSLA